MIRDILTDIVAHTSPVGFVNAKIVSDKKETTIQSVAKDVMLEAVTHFPVNEFKGTFGLPNLSILNLLLKNPEYKENPKIDLITDQTDNKLKSIYFQNEDQDYSNNYHLMSTEVVNSLINFEFSGPDYDIEFEPNLNSIQRLKSQQTIHSGEILFQTKLEKSNLIVSIGGVSSVHIGNFVFQPNVKGKLKNIFNWPIQEVISILLTDGDKSIKISDHGLMLITVDSGLVIYNYILAAQSK